MNNLIIPLKARPKPMNNIESSMNTITRLHMALFAHVTAIFNEKREEDSEEDSEEDNEQHHGRTYLEFDE